MRNRIKKLILANINKFAIGGCNITIDDYIDRLMLEYNKEKV